MKQFLCWLEVEIGPSGRFPTDWDLENPDFFGIRDSKLNLRTFSGLQDIFVCKSWSDCMIHEMIKKNIVSVGIRAENHTRVDVDWSQRSEISFDCSKRIRRWCVKEQIESYNLRYIFKKKHLDSDHTGHFFSVTIRFLGFSRLCLFIAVLNSLLAS